jgi:Tol biopolymer transport system component/DNA-binding winged helix-turn-helix (wHTH) protein
VVREDRVLSSGPFQAAMESSARRQGRARFGEFELDLGSGELRRRGVPVSIPDQPLRVLEVLVEHAGIAVSREQLRARLWPADTFVDFEHGLNAAVKRLRDALGDSADHPRFIETVPKRGYRFIAPVDGLAPPPVAEVSVRPGGTRRRVLAAAAVLAVVVVGLGGWRLLRSTSAPEPPSKLLRLTFDSGLQTEPTVSPDGTLIAYASNQSGNFDIWVRPLAGGEAYQLTNDPADDTQPDWSPDGKWIAFRSERSWMDAGSQRSTGGLFRVSRADRRVERISPVGFAPRYSPDGARLVFSSGAFYSSTYYLAAADGSGAAAIAGAPSVTASRELTAIGWHPGGRLTFLYGGWGVLRLSSLSMDSRSVVAHEAAAAVTARVASLVLDIADREPLAWSADGRTLYFVAAINNVKSLWQMTVDASLTMVDGPRRVTTTGESDGRPVALPGGGVAFASSTSARRVWLFHLDASGRALAGAPTPATPPEWNASQPALSPDGREMVIQVVPIGGSQRELRLVGLDGGAPRRVRTLTGDEIVFLTHWSPHDRRLLYGYRFVPKGKERSSIRLLDLATLQESNVTSDAPFTSADNPSGWSQRGTAVLANGSRYVGKGFSALVRLPLAAAPKAEAGAVVLVKSADRGLWNATESPDGRWVCYNATDMREGRDSALYVVASDAGTPHMLTTGEWDDYPHWSADGRFVYFVSRRGARFGLWGIGFDTARGVADGPAFEVTSFTTVQGGIDMDDLGFSTLSVAGSRVAVPLQYRTGGIWLLH